MGTGWLGFSLAEYLVAQGFEVKGSTRSSARMTILEGKDIQPFVINLTNEEYESAGFFNSKILIINIPFKGVSAFSALIDVIEKSNIAHVIFISSTSVYGNKQGLISEDDFDCLLPCALLEIEKLFTTNKNFSTTVIRFGGLIGYRRNPALFFKNNRSVKNPEARVNMIHRDDCINIIALIIEHKVWGETFNCCADTHPTKREFYSYAAMQSGLPIPHFSKDNNDPAYKRIGNNKVKKFLKYKFIHPDLMNIKF